MSDGIMAMMIGVSTLLGAIGLLGLLWAVKNGHFDDHKKFTDAVRFDGEEELNEAATLEQRKKEAKRKRHD